VIAAMLGLPDGDQRIVPTIDAIAPKTVRISWLWRKLSGEALGARPSRRLIHHQLGRQSLRPGTFPGMPTHCH
jgi:hypothetical protein